MISPQNHKDFSKIEDFSIKLGLRVEKLSPSHAVIMQRMFAPGTSHLADYFAWGGQAQLWTTKDCLFWIQELLRQPMPAEYYVFFQGRDMVGSGVLGSYKTGFGHLEDVKHVQMAYWLGKNHLGKRLGDCIVRVIEEIAFQYRGYSYLHVIHDSSNHKTSHMAIRLGYEFKTFFDGEIRAKNESGLYYNWVKVNPHLENVRTINLPTSTRILDRSSLRKIQI